MNRIPSNVLKFASGNTDLYMKFSDYWNHYRSINGEKNVSFQTTRVVDGKEQAISFSEKEAEMNKALLAEVMKFAGISSMSDFPIEAWANNPSLKWAAFSIVSALIDMILPDSLIQSTGIYADVRAIGFGDSASFEVKPRDLFLVSKHGRAQRTAQAQKQFNGMVTIVPELREMTVEVALYKVLAGKESLADFTAKAVRSLEVEMARDVYTTFNTAMAALDNAGDDLLRVAGYTQNDLISLGQKVSAWNGGQKAMIVGTQLALQNILPTDANYRYTLESDFVKLGYIQNVFGFDVMLLPQVADYKTPFKTLLDDTKLYVVSPSANKLVKIVMEGSTMANVDSTYANANLMQGATFYKSWGSAIATNAVAGVITLA
jgi:hypothetical protein